MEPDGAGANGAPDAPPPAKRARAGSPPGPPAGAAAAAAGDGVEEARPADGEAGRDPLEELPVDGAPGDGAVAGDGARPASASAGSEEHAGGLVEEGDIPSDDEPSPPTEHELRLLAAQPKLSALLSLRKRWTCRNCTDANRTDPPGLKYVLRLTYDINAGLSRGDDGELLTDEEAADRLHTELDAALAAASPAEESERPQTPAEEPKCNACGSVRGEAPPGAGTSAFELDAAIPDAELPVSCPLVTYDARMLLHDERKDEGAMGGVHPERPDRLRAAVGSLAERGLLERMHYLKPREASRGELLAVHTEELVDKIGAIAHPPPVPKTETEGDAAGGGTEARANGVILVTPETAEQPEGALAELNTVTVAPGEDGPDDKPAQGADANLNAQPQSEQPEQQQTPGGAQGDGDEMIGTPPQVTYLTADTFANEHSPLAARLAAGAAAGAAQAVAHGDAPSAVALVRPPGHHAEQAKSMGFCLFNNAAVAARAAQAAGCKRVLILDWDVHHCNGTQDIFKDDNSVLVVSMHRFDGGQFYPGTGAASSRGEGEGTFYNINLAWPTGGAGDADYITALQTCLLPVCYEFQPDITIVSAGFDAARDDPLGGCDVTPKGYAHMLWQLMPVTGGKVVVLMEGGYNLKALAASTDACVEALLGKVPPPLDAGPPSAACAAAIREMLRVHAGGWKSLHSAALSLDKTALSAGRAFNFAQACGGLPVPMPELGMMPMGMYGRGLPGQEFQDAEFASDESDDDDDDAGGMGLTVDLMPAAHDVMDGDSDSDGEGHDEEDEQGAGAGACGGEDAEQQEIEMAFEEDTHGLDEDREYPIVDLDALDDNDDVPGGDAGAEAAAGADAGGVGDMETGGDSGEGDSGDGDGDGDSQGSDGGSDDESPSP